MPRPETTGFQKPLVSTQRRNVRVATVKVEHADAGSWAECSCKYTTYHRRAKVVDKRIEKHINNKHGGQAMWL